jgi:hypothetical protein
MYQLPCTYLQICIILFNNKYDHRNGIFPFKILIGMYRVAVIGTVNWSLSTEDHILCVCVCACIDYLLVELYAVL